MATPRPQLEPTAATYASNSVALPWPNKTDVWSSGKLLGQGAEAATLGDEATKATPRTGINMMGAAVCAGVVQDPAAGDADKTETADCAYSSD